MICDDCGSEEFSVLATKRNARWSEERDCWVFDSKTDTRVVVCNGCPARYYDESRRRFALVYDEETLKYKRVPIEKYKPRHNGRNDNQQQMF
jgi:hypothetical protein